MNDEERGLVALVIGYQLRRARRQRNLSQADLAKGIGSQSMMSLLESGRQLPPSDVLELLAQRLDDGTLRSYAHMIAHGNFSFAEFSSTNRDVLLQALRTHRGRWHDIHIKLSLELCEYFYKNKLFHAVDEICHLVLQHSDDEVAHVQAWFYLGSSLLFLGDYEQALVWLNQAGSKYTLLDDTLRGRLFYNLGYAHAELDVCGVAIWYAKLATDVFLQSADYVRYARALGLLGTIQSHLGRAEEARTTLERAYEIMDKWEMDASDRARVATSIADVCEGVGDVASAEQWCLRAIDTGTKASDLISLSMAYQILSLVYKTRDERARAAEAAKMAIHHAENLLDKRILCRAYLVAVSVLNDMAERIQLAEKAFRTASESHHAIEQAVAAEWLANVPDAAGDSQTGEYRSAAFQAYRQHCLESSTYSYFFQRLSLGELMNHNPPAG